MANPFFNAEYYLAQNADVAEAVDGDLEVAEQHYFLHGAREADSGENVARKPAPWFDIEFYRASNEKLADVPADQLFLHFTLHGIREGLSPMEGVDFDAATYLAANEDLVEGLGIEDPENLTEEEATLLAQHFFAHGYKEGRDGGPDIPEDVDPVDRTELAEALQNLEAAEDAVDEFLEENGAEEPEEIETRLDDAVLALAQDRIDNGTEGQLAAAVVTAEANRDAAEQRYEDNASDELVAAVNVYRAETKKLVELKEVRDEAQANAEEQFEAFVAEHPDSDFNEDPITDGRLIAFVADPEDPEADPVEVVLAQFAPFDPADPTEGGRIVITPAGEEYDGINELVSSINSWLSASDAVNAQQVIRNAAKDEVNNIDSGDSFFTDLEDAEVALDEAIEAVDARQQMIDDVAAAEELVAQLELLLADVDAAWDALGELGYESIEPALGDVTASGEGEIFVFVEEDASITGFGQEADDVLYFDASEFTYNTGEITDGDNNVREFFLQQDGDNVLVLFEQNDYGSASDQFDTITLVGTDVGSVQVDDLGFISL